MCVCQRERKSRLLTSPLNFLLQVLQKSLDYDASLRAYWEKYKTFGPPPNPPKVTPVQPVVNVQGPALNSTGNVNESFNESRAKILNLKDDGAAAESQQSSTKNQIILLLGVTVLVVGGLVMFTEEDE